MEFPLIKYQYFKNIPEQNIPEYISKIISKMKIKRFATEMKMKIKNENSNENKHGNKNKK